MARYNVKGTPWDLHPGSVDVSDCTTAQEVMQKAGLNYTVEKCPLAAKMYIDTNDIDKVLDDINAGSAFVHGQNIYRDCPNAFSTYRTDKNIPLGIVKGKYEVVQNTAAFNFFDDAIGKDKAIFQRAGFFGNGEKVFVAVKLPNNIVVKGDPCDEYLMFTNSHDGSGSVSILFTPIRVVCKNTLARAIKTAENYVRFKHTQSVHQRILTGKDILGIAEKMRVETATVYNAIANITVTDDEVQAYIANHFLTDKDIERVKSTDTKLMSIFNRNGYAIQNTELSMRKVNQMVDCFEYYLDGPGQREIRGTAWGAYNAITGYYSNVDNISGEKRTEGLLFGSKATAMANALEAAYV